MSTTKSLTQIMFEFKEIFELLEESEGLMTPELEEALAINRSDFKEKITNYRYVIKLKETIVEDFKIEAKFLAARIKAEENTVARLEYVMVEALKKYGERNPTKSGKITYFQELENGHKVSAISYPKLKILDEDAVPKDYKNSSISLPKMLATIAEDYIAKLEEAGIPFDEKLVVDAVQLKAAIEKEEVDYAEIDDNYKLKIS